MFPWDAVVGGASQLLGGAIGASSAGSINRETMRFQERMSSTAYQRAVKDMRAAGLNPMMMYGGAGGAASSPSPQLNVPGESMGRGLSSAAASAMTLRNLRKQGELLDQTIAVESAKAFTQGQEFRSLKSTNDLLDTPFDVLREQGFNRTLRFRNLMAGISSQEANAASVNAWKPVRQAIGELVAPLIGPARRIGETTGEGIDNALDWTRWFTSPGQKMGESGMAIYMRLRQMLQDRLRRSSARE